MAYLSVQHAANKVPAPGRITLIMTTTTAIGLDTSGTFAAALIISLSCVSKTIILSGSESNFYLTVFLDFMSLSDSYRALGAMFCWFFEAMSIPVFFYVVDYIN